MAYLDRRDNDLFEDNTMKRLTKSAISTLLLAMLPMLATAEEAVQQIEEVVVTGAVRSNDSVAIANIDLPEDAAVQEMAISFE
jgi:hypothetical protein